MEDYKTQLNWLINDLDSIYSSILCLLEATEDKETKEKTKELLRRFEELEKQANNIQQTF